MSIKTLGRCPDCGAPAPIVAGAGLPTETLEHGCQARACNSSGCLVIRPSDEMIHFPSGEWYCASHALLCAARTLVSLHQSGSSQDLMAVLLNETVPAVLDRFPR